MRDVVALDVWVGIPPFSSRLLRMQATIWHMVWAYIRPSTQSLQCAYVAFVEKQHEKSSHVLANHAGPATAMLSYSWSCTCALALASALTLPLDP